MMWKNVRAIIALSVAIAYIIFTGYQTFNENKVPDNFYAITSLVLGFYFVTRAAERGVIK